MANPLLNDPNLWSTKSETANEKYNAGRNIVAFDKGDTAQSAQSLALQESQQAQAQNGGNATQSADASASFLAPKHSFAPTGFKYFDDKMAKGTLNVLDGYIAKELLGLDLTKQLNVNANVNMKSVSATKPYNDLTAAFNTLALGKKVADMSNDNVLGIDEGVHRWLSHKTNGAIGMNEELARFDTAQNQYAFNQANILTDGRVTNKDKEMAQELYGAGGKGKAQYIASLSEGQTAALIKVDTLISDLAARGYPVPAEILAIRHYFDANKRYMQEQGANYRKEEFEKEYNKAFGNGSVEAINSYLRQMGAAQ